jgi:PAS domain S-box-containing protein
MNWFRRFSLGWKLTFVIMLGSGAALLVTSLASLTLEWITYRQDAVRAVSATADLVGEATAAAVAFDDVGVAKEMLGRLKSQPAILTARLFTRDDKLFAEYVRPGTTVPPLPPGRTATPEFAAGDVRLCRPIVLAGEPVGTICVRADLQEWFTRAGNRIGLMALTALGALLVALVLGAWLQRWVSAPVLELARTAQTVTEKHDYSLRVEPVGTDEIGHLAQAFNQMLVTIQDRNQALRLANVELEQNSRQLQDELLERRRAERTLRDREARLQALLEQVPAVLWTTDRELRFTSSTGTGLTILGVKSGDVVGKSLAEFFGTTDPQFPALTAHQRALRGRTVTFDQKWGGRHYESRVEPLYDEHRVISGCIGVALDVTDRIRAEQELLVISDREQHRIGQDLHDGLCQHLTGTAFACKALEERLRSRGLTGADSVANIGELVETAIQQARQMARGLSPLVLTTEHGLESALHELATGIRDAAGVACEFRSTGAVECPDPTMAINLYRIAQEAANNAVRHGRPKRIEIALSRVEGRLHLMVSDDGVGIPEMLKDIEGLGLRIMAYRAKLIGAGLDIRRGSAGGTAVTCSVPVPASGS